MPRFWLPSFIFIFFAAHAQDVTNKNIIGAPNVVNYNYREYLANPIILDITSDNQGFLYFANQRGVLQYDGERWTLIRTTRENEVFTLHTTDKNEILVGTNAGFGLLEKKSNGELYYKDTTTVLDFLDEEINAIISNKDYILIKSLKKVFVLNRKFELITAYSNNVPLRGLSIIGNEFFFQDRENGIISFKENVMKKIQDTDFFNNKRVAKIISFKGKKLIVTESAGIFEWKDDDFKLLYYTEDFTFTNVSIINENFISLGTYSSGIVLLNEKFELIYNIDNEKGIIDDGIKVQFLDKNNQLWIGTYNGISKIDILSPVNKYFNKLKSVVIESINSYNNHLIISSLGGVYVVDSLFSVEKINSINNDCYGVDKITINDEQFLFISELSQLSILDQNFQTKKVVAGGPYGVIQSPLNSNHLVVLHFNSIELINYENGEFTSLFQDRDFSEGEPFNFIIQEDGTIWIGTKPDDGIYRTHINNLIQKKSNYKKYHMDEGLPSGHVYLFDFENKIYVGTEKGLFKYNPEKDNFEYSNDFNFFKDDSKPKVIHRLNKDHDNKVWAILIDEYTNLSEIGYSKKIDNEFVWNSDYFTNYSEFIVHSIYHDISGKTWLGGTGDGLLSFDNNKVNTSEYLFSLLLRVINIGDSVIYHGNMDEIPFLKFSYDPKKQVRFSFGNNFFLAENQVEYSYYIEGIDEKWSSWTTLPYREISLIDGNFVLHVKARNFIGQETEMISIPYSVTPPWFRTIWAYTSYLILFVLVFYISIKLSIKRIKSQNVKLENIVSERTKEVTAQKFEAEKQRDIAENQKVLLEEKNQEILDSISYAKRIQSAILPSSEIISKIFNNNFVLYLPKDIVAGDFYWLHSENDITEEINADNSIYFAAADCTGHGVPGAMVSVVCNNALNITLNEYKINQPSLILERVRELIISEFSKSDAEIKDGMDIALCKINTSKEEKNTFNVEYAGANNPLWIVRNTNENKEELATQSEYKRFSLDDDNGVALFEIKADKQPIGKFFTSHAFTNHELKLKKGDLIYLFSDGYQDQFGGEAEIGNIKKFKPSSLRNLLLKNHHLSMEEQKEILHERFINWKGNQEQVDDICIIGLKL